MGIEVTPELRAAVYAADCQQMGHLIDVKVGYGEQDDVDVLTGRAGEDDELPHVYCRRCGRVWVIVADSPGVDYDQAEAQILDRLAEGDSLVALAVDKREQRLMRRERQRRGLPH